MPCSLAPTVSNSIPAHIDECKDWADKADVDVAATLGALVEDLHQLVEILTEWASHRRNSAEVKE